MLAATSLFASPGRAAPDRRERTPGEHVARLRAQDARYDEQEAADPGGTKWQKMTGAWVTQVKKSAIPVHDEAEIAAQLTGRTSSFTNRGQ
jgi:hypothetical protein